MPKPKKADNLRSSDAAEAGRLAIIAGGGRLPIQIADHLREEGKCCFVVILNGEVEDPAAFGDAPQARFDLEQAGAVIARLKKEGVTRLVMAGTVKRRPKLLGFRPILPLLPVVARLVPALARGDDNLLRLIINYVESHGIKVVGAHELMPDLVVGPGIHTRTKPSAADEKDIAAAYEAAKAIGQLDIGQAAVAVGGRAIALEGIEGTDGLLERVAALRGHGRLSGRKGGVLVKCVKPGQEQRADLPSIGVNTVEAVHVAQLRGIAVEADSSLALGFKELIDRADQLGIFVVGIAETPR